MCGVDLCEGVVWWAVRVSTSGGCAALKLADLTVSPGLDGQVAPFDHPLFQTMLMFSGMAMVLVPWHVGAVWAAARGRGAGMRGRPPCGRGGDASGAHSVFHEGDGGGDDARRAPGWRGLLLLALPSLLDTCGTTLALVGLLLTYGRAACCVRDLLDAPTALAACCGFDLCHKHILYVVCCMYGRAACCVRDTYYEQMILVCLLWFRCMRCCIARRDAPLLCTSECPAV